MHLKRYHYKTRWAFLFDLKKIKKKKYFTTKYLHGNNVNQPNMDLGSVSKFYKIYRHFRIFGKRPHRRLFFRVKRLHNILVTSITYLKSWDFPWELFKTDFFDRVFIFFRSLKKKFFFLSRKQRTWLFYDKRVLYFYQKRAFNLSPDLWYLQLFSFYSKLRINLQEDKRKNIMVLYSGLFQKLLLKGKSFRKSKSSRFIIYTYFWYIFRFFHLPPFIFEILRSPRFAKNFLKFIISGKVEIKFNMRYVPDLFKTVLNRKPIKMYFILFKESIKFSTQKLPKRGRIKRKVYRKLKRIESPFE